jgi:hypothetical protein
MFSQVDHYAGVCVSIFSNVTRVVIVVEFLVEFRIKSPRLFYLSYL